MGLQFVTSHGGCCWRPKGFALTISRICQAHLAGVTANLLVCKVEINMAYSPRLRLLQQHRLKTWTSNSQHALMVHNIHTHGI